MPNAHRTSERPRVVLGMPESAWSESLAAQLRRRGVGVVQTVQQATWLRKLRGSRPTVLVLPARSPLESGWLLAAKLRHTLPTAQIVLLADAATGDRFRPYAGLSAVLPTTAGVATIADAVSGLLPLPR